MKQLSTALEKLGSREAPWNESEQCDATIIQTMPGIGMIVAATLLSEAAELLRTGDYQALRAPAGVVPVTKRSGKRCGVVASSTEPLATRDCTTRPTTGHASRLCATRSQSAATPHSELEESHTAKPSDPSQIAY
ncbi:MAG: transposase [Planctomycetota bacterium]